MMFKLRPMVVCKTLKGLTTTGLSGVFDVCLLQAEWNPVLPPKKDLILK
jgi:hypothetical protein